MERRDEQPPEARGAARRGCGGRSCSGRPPGGHPGPARRPAQQHQLPGARYPRRGWRARLGLQRVRPRARQPGVPR
eukprot:3586162-Lingulodinium_polyedra.AAC.1